MSHQDLTNLYGNLARDLWLDKTDEVILSASNVPSPPEEIQANSIRANWVWHYYNFPVPKVDILASRASLCQLGLLILGKLFHRCGDVVVRLGSTFRPEGVTLKGIVLDYSHEPSSYSGYKTNPEEFCFSPDAGCQQWQYRQIPRKELPHLALRSSKNGEFDIQKPQEANLGIGFGTDHGNALLAELLLGLGAPNSKTLEVSLESEAGNGGVAPDSAELRFILPGHPFYMSDEPADLIDSV